MLLFYRRGLDNVKANSVINRMYSFASGDSSALAALLAFAYTGCIPGVPSPSCSRRIHLSAGDRLNPERARAWV